ncbi:MAG: NAD-glutamate dehydrogenase, partial [Ilumatobacteraceae bacterium]
MPDEDEHLIEAFVRRYLAGVEPAALTQRPPSLLGALIATHWEIGVDDPAAVSLRIVDSSPGRLALLAVLDDVPFLVDSLRAALTRCGLGIHLTVHPMLEIRRDASGRVVDVGGHDGVVEAWTLVEFEECADSLRHELVEELQSVVADVVIVTSDRDAMRGRARQLAERLRAGGPDAHRGGAEFLGWLTRGRFVFLGAARYQVTGDGMTYDASSGLGLLRADHEPDPPMLPREGRLVVCRTDAVSRVHRPERMTCIAVRTMDDEGRVTAVDRIVGLFSSTAYRESATETPLLREKADEVLRTAGYPADSHAGRALRWVLESLPRDELFEIESDELYDLATGIAQLEERQVVRVFPIEEPGNRYVMVLVFFPRSRFTERVAADVAAAVRDAFDGDHVDVDRSVSDSALARLDVLVRRRPDSDASPDLGALERDLDELTTSWAERLAALLPGATDRHEALATATRFVAGIPAEYRATHDPAEAVQDLLLVASCAASPSPTLRTALQSQSDDRAVRFTLYRHGSPATLSAVLPLLEHLGVEVVDQRPYEFVAADGEAVWVSEIGLKLPSNHPIDAATSAEFQRSFSGLVAGELEDDRFNQLVLLAGLTGAQIAVLRAYARYLRQLGFAASQPAMERMLANWPDIARLLIARFDARFAPDVVDRDAAEAELDERLGEALDAVPSLDEDRIGRALWGLIRATVRSNAHRQWQTAGIRPVLAFKFDPAAVPELPVPRPAHEIFVSSPSVEGVHLRGGRIARGGLRWSDRLEDFRTEVLGLMKAQTVKNAVIVPVGAKGGFVVRRPPNEAEARRAEVVECYRSFVAGLLELTDDIVGPDVVRPEGLVVHDGDDPYLVVAADKGTATFSDTANAVAEQYGFWLGDAFASGGSEGYDHKAMGITARGAW